MHRVQVRSFKPHEGKKLVALMRQNDDAIAVRRAEVIVRSGQGESPDQIAGDLHLSADYVRKIIAVFNERGLASLRAQYCNGGAPKKVQPEHEANLVELALTPPRVTGLPFTHWSLEKLRDEALRRKLVPMVSLETVRQILMAYNISLQRTKTWKQSNDPEFERKKKPSNASTRRPRRARRK